MIGALFQKNNSLKVIIFLTLLQFSGIAQAQALVKKIRFVPTIKGEAVVIGKQYALPFLSDSVKFETIRFYISHVSLLRNNEPFGDGQNLTSDIENKLFTLNPINPNPVLVDASLPASQIIVLENVILSEIWAKLGQEANLENGKTRPENQESKTISKGEFSTIRFSIGIDGLTNVSGALGGDLDPTLGMYWAWQSGYINLKVEGQTKDCPARKNLFQFHLGGYQSPFNALQEVELTLPKFSNTPSGKSLHADTVVVNVALDEWLAKIDLAETYQVMSPGQEAVDLVTLFSTVFSIRQ